jgi:hypothetical protein
MVGIILSLEQIRAAPLEVRRWLEAEVLAGLGLPPNMIDQVTEPELLFSASQEDVRKIFEAIRGSLPVLLVFFELGRRNAAGGPPGMAVVSLVKILAHAKLSNTDQVLAALRIIDDAAAKIRNDPTSHIFLRYGQDYCVVAEQTQRSIAALWEEFATEHAKAAPAPLDMSANVPPGAIHLGQMR